MSLLDRLADRIHAQGDTAARAQGLTVTRLPGGRRSIGHPDLPALLEARRAAALRNGLDPADRLLLDAGTVAAVAATRERLTARRR